MDAVEALELLRADPTSTGIFTDFDGTLSEIVDRPEEAQSAAGAAEALEALSHRFAVVGVVSGRSLDDLRTRLPLSGVVLAGSYGRERSDRPSLRRRVEGWETVALAAASMISELPGVVLERKGAGVALHYRMAPHYEEDARRMAQALAGEFELEVLQGRLVVELVRPGPGKGAAVAALASEHDLTALLFAGDDVADLEAFEWARASPVRSVLVAVTSEEAPAGLKAMADLVVAGPAELIAFLNRLA